MHEMPANDAMRERADPDAPHFAPTSALLFAPRTRGGLGITPVYEFLRAGVVTDVEHLREGSGASAGSGAGEWDWNLLLVLELRSEHPELVDTARAQEGWRAV